MQYKYGSILEPNCTLDNVIVYSMCVCLCYECMNNWILELRMVNVKAVELKFFVNFQFSCEVCKSAGPSKEISF
jgi:hypothetical protein